MKLQKQLFFKFFLLMMLSLKFTFVVYQTVSHLSNSDEIAHVLDSEKSDKEEKIELDESVKIQQKLYPAFTFFSKKNKKNLSNILLNYKVLHQEYTTPPPEKG